MRPALSVAVFLAALLAFDGGVGAQTTDLLLVLAADVSRSIDESEFALQRKGYSAALTDPRVLAAIRGGASGTIAICFVEWSGAGEQNIVADWTMIRDEEDAGGLAAAILAAPRELKEITAEVAQWTERQRLSVGLLTLYIPHTSASLLIQENASPEVRRDLSAFLRRLVPEDVELYRHNDEGPDDMPAHIKSALTQTQLSIPVTDGRLQLGTWQGIFLLEHRASPHRRELVLTLIGEKE